MKESVHPAGRKPERAAQEKVRDQSVRLCPIILSPAYQKKVCPSNNYQHPTGAFSPRNRGNKELPRQSNCSVLQGTKVGSTKEHNRHILIPQRVSQQVSTLSPSKVYQTLRKLSILQQISTFPSYIHIFLTSIPGSLGLKIVPRRQTNIQRNRFPQHIKTSPRESSPI